MQLLDCTLRDGGYVNNWNFSLEMAKDYCKTVGWSGVNFIEIGLLGDEISFPVNQYGLFRRINRQIASELSAESKSQIAVMIDYGKYNINSLREDCGNDVSLVRVASHKKDIYQAADWVGRINSMGYLSALQMMNFPSYSIGEVKNFIDFLLLRRKEDLPNFLYVADSYGSMYPCEVNEAFSCLEPLSSQIKLGFHPHNNLQLAFANSIEASKTCCSTIDATVMGIGRGSGNLPLELFMMYAKKHMLSSYDPIEILEFAEKWIEPLMRNNTVGYNLLLAAAGYFGCHPDYTQDLNNKNIREGCRFFRSLTNNKITTYVKNLSNEFFGERK